MTSAPQDPRPARRGARAESGRAAIEEGGPQGGPFAQASPAAGPTASPGPGGTANPPNAPGAPGAPNAPGAPGAPGRKAVPRAAAPARAGGGGVLLEVRGLVKSFKKRRVVDGVSFVVHAGEIVGLLGSNGAGKTTSFRMTVGLTKPDAGEVRLAGKECSRLPMFKRARLGMGYLPQERSIFQRLSVRDNLLAVLEAMPLKRPERHAEAQRLMSELEIAHLEHSIADTLSGGERRRLELARALATRPKILLLDEPFAGVDPIAVQEIQELVLAMRARNIGILITDHNVRETLQSTDRAYIIHQGRILREGRPRELVNDPRVREVYLGHSFDAPTLGVSQQEEQDLLQP